ncbi:VirB4 family type IV secretion system protein [Exiguobacterium undae]|uniref:Type IV secretion system protein VirB4 n=1 Tax=Exiguobacterium undae TaxID=169177 RepID=A0ABX2V7V2_9BACL|nr:type IV secretion system VirB4 protein [Exiguobacterium undae]OAN13398.1 type IV secretion system protein VirB4 [Exiguobacterium undae]
MWRTRFLRKQDPETIKQLDGYNPTFVQAIQPQGGLRFEPNYVRTGDGYLACLHVYKYQSTVYDFWLEPILNLPGVLTTLDIGTADKREMIRTINKSMAEQNTRFENAKDNVDRIDARETYKELNELYEQITQGETMKYLHLRLYVKAKTLDVLERQVQDAMEELEARNFRVAVFLNEQEWEWQSLFLSYEQQQKLPNRRRGKEIPSLSIAGGYPFHFTSLQDPTGTYYGTTDTNGSVIFDLFHKDKQRKFYNALMIGKMGSGKSTLLKKTVLDQAIKGNHVRILDVTGEFSDLVRQLGGKEIALDGSAGRINPLHVYKTVTHADGSADEALSFMQHLSKIAVFYHYINPAATQEEANEFEILLRQLYLEKGLWNEDGDAPITTHPANAYPVFSDFLALVRSELYVDAARTTIRESISTNRVRRLENIELAITNLVHNYGNIFDGHSSIERFDEEAIVSFPLRNLTNLKDEIFQAQVFNLMNMLWDGMILNGAGQLRSYNQGELLIEDAFKYLIVIDEAHHLINTRDIAQPAILYLQQFMREARKYFGGIFFASHLITDFVPTGSKSENAENVKTLFQLTQYKFIGEQDAESIPTIQTVFDGQLTESETRLIPSLETGRIVLSISGVKTLIFDVDVSPEELTLFGGGA